MDDDSSSSSASSNSAADPGSFFPQLQNMDVDDDPSARMDLLTDMQEEGSLQDCGRKDRSPNCWGYLFDNWMKCPYYIQYLHPKVIDRT